MYKYSYFKVDISMKMSLADKEKKARFIFLVYSL